METPIIQMLPKWVSLCSLWFTGPAKWQALAYSGAVILLSVFSTLLNVQISYARRDFSTALSSKDIGRFWKGCVSWSIARQKCSITVVLQQYWRKEDVNLVVDL